MPSFSAVVDDSRAKSVRVHHSGNTSRRDAAENLDQIARNEFFVMALPFKVQGLDSSFVRAIVIEET